MRGGLSTGRRRLGERLAVMYGEGRGGEGGWLKTQNIAVIYFHVLSGKIDTILTRNKTIHRQLRNLRLRRGGRYQRLQKQRVTNTIFYHVKLYEIHSSI